MPLQSGTRGSQALQQSRANAALARDAIARAAGNQNGSEAPTGKRVRRAADTAAARLQDVTNTRFTATPAYDDDLYDFDDEEHEEPARPPSENHSSAQNLPQRWSAYATVCFSSTRTQVIDTVTPALCRCPCNCKSEQHDHASQHSHSSFTYPGTWSEPGSPGRAANYHRNVDQNLCRAGPGEGQYWSAHCISNYCTLTPQSPTSFLVNLFCVCLKLKASNS